MQKNMLNSELDEIQLSPLNTNTKSCDVQYKSRQWKISMPANANTNKCFTPNVTLPPGCSPSLAAIQQLLCQLSNQAILPPRLFIQNNTNTKTNQSGYYIDFDSCCYCYHNMWKIEVQVIIEVILNQCKIRIVGSPYTMKQEKRALGKSLGMYFFNSGPSCCPIFR